MTTVNIHSVQSLDQQMMTTEKLANLLVDSSENDVNGSAEEDTDLSDA